MMNVLGDSEKEQRLQTIVRELGISEQQKTPFLTFIPQMPSIKKYGWKSFQGQMEAAQRRIVLREARLNSVAEAMYTAAMEDRLFERKRVSELVRVASSSSDNLCLEATSDDCPTDPSGLQIVPHLEPDVGPTTVVEAVSHKVQKGKTYTATISNKTGGHWLLGVIASTVPAQGTCLHVAVPGDLAGPGDAGQVAQSLQSIQMAEPARGGSTTLQRDPKLAASSVRR
jgi:hypothetical protein